MRQTQLQRTERVPDVTATQVTAPEKPVAADALDSRRPATSAVATAVAALVTSSATPRSRVDGDWLSGSGDTQLKQVATSLAKGDASKVDGLIDWLRETQAVNPQLFRTIVASELAASAPGPTLVEPDEVPARAPYLLMLKGQPVDLASYRSTPADRAAFKEATIQRDSQFASDRTQAPWNGRVEKLKQDKAADPALASIPDEDLIALRAYTGSKFATGSVTYKELNPALRHQDQTVLDRADAQLRLSVSALLQLPAVTGNVFRGVNLSPEALEAYRPGATVIERSFTSTSVAQAAVEPFIQQHSEKPAAVFVIEAAGFGRSLSSMSAYENEREVLFGPGQRFEVMKRKTDEKQRAVITLRAVA
jgi:hypothetical protein